MANQYRNTIILNSDSHNLGTKRIYVSYEDDITFEQKAIQELYDDMDTYQSKYNDMVGVCNSFVPTGGTFNSGNLISDTDLLINYTDSDGIEQKINKTYSTGLSIADKTKFDSLKSHAITLISMI